MSSLATIAVVGAAAGAYGAYQTNRTNEQNADQARSDEESRRERASEELARTVEAYNELRDERPGLSFKDFAREQITALNDPALLEAFRNATDESFDIAQGIADKATRSNLDNFNAALEEISGGQYEELIDTRNNLVLEDTSQQAFQRAAELQTPFALPAGSVKVGPDGRPIGGQRGDAFTFQLAFETQDQIRQRQLQNVNNILRDDRDAATRQQERASTFLDNSDFAGFASNVASDALASRLAFQQLDEQRQFGVIKDFQAAAFGDKTRQPTPFNNQGNFELISSSLDLAGTAASEGRLRETPQTYDRGSNR